ncbi:hypothetical protein [Nitrospira sp. Nam80]
MVRQRFRGLLDGYADIHIVGEGVNGEEAVALSNRLKPPVVAMDVNMSKMGGKRPDGSSRSSTMSRLSVCRFATAGTSSRRCGRHGVPYEGAAVQELYQSIRRNL